MPFDGLRNIEPLVVAHEAFWEAIGMAAMALVIVLLGSIV